MLGSLIAVVAWLVPIVVMALYLRSRWRRIGDRSANLVVTDIVVFPFVYMLAGMVSMLGAYALSPALRTPTIAAWLLLVIVWSALHSYRWRPKLGLASASLFLMLSVLLSYVAYQHFLRTADKPYWAAEEVQKWGKCTDNLEALGKSMAMYVGDNDGRLPVARWTDSLARYADTKDFECPELPGQIGYTMNSEALGITSDWVDARFVIAYDGEAGENRVAPGPAGVRWAHSRETMAMVLLAMGNVERMNKYRLFRYIWDRETALNPPESSPFDR